MGMPATERRWWTRAEVLALMEAEPLHWPRYELVDGELLVTPSPRNIHQHAVGRLHYLLMLFTEKMGVARPMTSPSDTQLEAGTLVQPDVYLISLDEMRREATVPALDSLLLAVEVLSPGSVRSDRGRKRALYQRTVPEYWIIDIDARCIERWKPNSVEADIVTDTIEFVVDGAESPFRLALAPYFAWVHDDRA